MAQAQVPWRVCVTSSFVKPLLCLRYGSMNGSDGLNSSRKMKVSTATALSQLRRVVPVSTASTSSALIGLSTMGRISASASGVGSHDPFAGIIPIRF